MRVVDSPYQTCLKFTHPSRQSTLTSQLSVSPSNKSAKWVRSFTLKSFFSRKIKLIDSTWLGGNDLSQEGDWRWVDGEAFTWGAALGSPTPQADTSVNCLITYSTKLWGPNPCDRKWPVLCEKDISKYVFKCISGLLYCKNKIFNILICIDRFRKIYGIHNNC